MKKNNRKKLWRRKKFFFSLLMFINNTKNSFVTHYNNYSSLLNELISAWNDWCTVLLYICVWLNKFLNESWISCRSKKKNIWPTFVRNKSELVKKVMMSPVSDTKKYSWIIIQILSFLLFINLYACICVTDTFHINN